MNPREHWGNRVRVGALCPACGAHFPSPQALGFIFIQLFILFKGISTSWAIKCFPLHPDSEMGSSSQTAHSIARLKSANTMHCKLINFVKEWEMEEREPFIYPKLRHFSNVKIWISFLVVLLCVLYRHKLLLACCVLFTRFSHKPEG